MLFVGKILIIEAGYSWWKTVRFTAFKFYRHVIMGDRNWIYEGEKVSRYAEYEFSDNPTANENTFPTYANKLASIQSRPKPTYAGPYQSPAE